MARDATQVMDFSEGYVFYAPLGTTLPTSINSILALVDTPGAWSSVGYISEDGLTMTPERAVEDIKAWAGRTTVRTIQTSFDFKFSFAMLETSDEAIELWQGDLDGISSATPAAYAWIILGTDGDEAIAWTVENGQPSEPQELGLGSGTGTMYGITVKTFPGDNGYNANGPYSTIDSIS
jgi:hypothetical protein